jgi:hypothetical protein
VINTARRDIAACVADLRDAIDSLRTAPHRTAPHRTAIPALTGLTQARLTRPSQPPW